MKEMKTSYRIFAAAVAAIGLLASCRQQEIESPVSASELVPVRLTATYSTMTKVSYAETPEMDLQPSWEVDDEIIGFDGDNKKYTFTVTEVDEHGVATLEGEAPANCTLHLIYLCGATASEISSGSLSVSYTDQAGTGTMPAVMVADGEVTGGSGSFHFKNPGAVIGIDATKGVPSGSTISSITISGSNLSSAKVALDGDKKLALTATSKTEDAISTASGFTATVTDDKGTLADIPVLIAVPAGAVVKEVSVSVVGDDDYFFTLPSPATLEANEYSYVKGQLFKKKERPGFSVSATKKVYFSPGNLQATYNGSKYTWSFAEHQYDYIGNAPGNTTIGNQLADSVVDLFSWSTSSSNWGIIIQILPKYYRGDFLDWGIAYCEQEGLAEGTWRTLSAYEWQYLFSYGSYDNVTRRGKYKYGVTVCGKANCLVIAPDDWDTATNELQSEYSITSTPMTWEQAEDAGLVCLPAAGLRGSGTSGVYYVGEQAQYWSSTPYDTDNAYNVSFNGSSFDPASEHIARMEGMSVRLVRDTNSDPIPTVVGVGQEDYVIGGAL